jgi:hypothetical protein
LSTANPTPAELLAQRDEIDRQIAIANLDGLKDIQAALKSGKVATLAADLEALLPQLAPSGEMGSPHSQATNVITTVRNVSNFFDGEVARVQAIVDAQAAA